VTAHAGSRRPRAVDGARWQEMLTLLDAAMRQGRRRGLIRLAEREGISSAEASRELAAFPSKQCSALEEGMGVRVSACTAAKGCAAAEECPFVRGSRDPSKIARSATAVMIEQMACRLLEASPQPAVASLSELISPVRDLLEESGRVGIDAAPRARTSLVLLDLAVKRAGPVDATGAYLTASEVELVAAFIPPQSARSSRRLREIEAWIRRVAASESALVEVYVRQEQES